MFIFTYIPINNTNNTAKTFTITTPPKIYHFLLRKFYFWFAEVFFSANNRHLILNNDFVTTTNVGYTMEKKRMQKYLLNVQYNISFCYATLTIKHITTR